MPIINVTNIVLDGEHSKLTLEREVVAGEVLTVQYVKNALAAK